MKKFDADLWSGVLGTLVCLGVGLPVIVLGLGGADITSIPIAAWTAIFGVFMLAYVLCGWFFTEIPIRVARAVFAVQVAAGIAVLFTAPGTGWLPILLVFTSALSTYLVPRWATGVVVAVNTISIGIAGFVASGSLLATLPVAALYLLLQGATVLSVMALERETSMRLELTEAHVELRAATTLLAESSRAEERLRIARELHDLVGHQLTVLALELETASHLSSPPASEHVDRARSVARQLLADVRSTVGEMRKHPGDLRIALAEVVRDLPTPEVHISVGEAVHTDEIVTTTLVRCVQEVVTNTIRHSQATELWIEIQADADGSVTLQAHDNGVGTATLVLGNGLRGMVERIERLGGSAQFMTSPAFSVRAQVPAP